MIGVVVTVIAARVRPAPTRLRRAVPRAPSNQRSLGSPCSAQHRRTLAAHGLQDVGLSDEKPRRGRSGPAGKADDTSLSQVRPICKSSRRPSSSSAVAPVRLNSGMKVDRYNVLTDTVIRASAQPSGLSVER